MRPASLLLVLLLGTSPGVAASWQLAAGPTRAEGSALEIARSTARWETALGYVSEQEVNVRTLQDTCTAGTAGPECVTLVSTADRPVAGYGYLSVQRKFVFREGGSLQPVLGVGMVANSDTNPYVSSGLTFSLSAGLRLGERWTLEWRHFSNAGLEQPNLGQDILLFRAAFE
ncbi:MAG: acyloxyacyl hydrolase [Chromatiales bacterium]|nr:acyloxyacyl hydrolase [Chromatiales bacterium]